MNALWMKKIPKQISLGDEDGKTLHDKQTVSSIHDIISAAQIFNGNVLILAFDIKVEK